MNPAALRANLRADVLVPELLADAFGGFVPREALGLGRQAAAA